VRPTGRGRRRRTLRHRRRPGHAPRRCPGRRAGFRRLDRCDLGPRPPGERSGAMSTSMLDTMLWGVLPYAVLVVLIGGTVWRYRYDRFGWTTRSSQLYESRLLRIGSPVFHFGLL